MVLSAVDVQRKTFNTELRGYSVDEVDRFLEEISATLLTYEEHDLDSVTVLGPLDVQAKTFKTELRGYSVDEVDGFLDEVVVTLGLLATPSVKPVDDAVRSGSDEPVELRLLDVKQIRFSTRFRGYDTAEVDAFREKVRRTMFQYERRIARVDGRLRDAERRLRSLSEDE